MMISGPREKEARCTLICINRPPVSDEWAAYTGYLGYLLGGQLQYHHPQSDRDWVNETWLKVDDSGTTAAERLIVLSDPEPRWWQRLLGRTPARWTVNQVRASLLFARQPRWPLRHILLVVRAHETDEAALAWVERLALPSQAEVTLLPIVPPFPRMYQYGNKVQPPLDVLLSPNTACGAALRQYAGRLRRLAIHGIVCQRQGKPDVQLHREVRDINYELIVIAAEPYGRLERWFLGELVGPLLGWADRPVLVAR